MRCDQGCRLCCSDVVPVSEVEFQAVAAYAKSKGIRPQFSDAEMCVWYQAGRCAIHEARPLLCHLYGHVDHPSLTCPRGYNANLSTEREAKAVFEAQSKLGAPVRYLHEILDPMYEPGAVESSVWRARVQPHVWDGVNKFREMAGLPALARKHNLHAEKPS
jgi:Fe-S-cluster containining protein